MGIVYLIGILAGILLVAFFCVFRPYQDLIMFRNWNFPFAVLSGMGLVLLFLAAGMRSTPFAAAGAALYAMGGVYGGRKCHDAEILEQYRKGGERRVNPRKRAIANQLLSPVGIAIAVYALLSALIR